MVIAATIIFSISFLGLAAIILKKLPILAELPVKEIEEDKILKKIRKKVIGKKIKFTSGNIVLQKALSKIRILTLKTDKKTSLWLSKLRQKSIEKKESFSEDYWQKLKKK